MSIDRCSRCDDLVDTDAEPEAYVQIANMRNREEYICLCRGCRERYEDERDEDCRQDRIADYIAADPRYGCKNCDWDVDGCAPCHEHAD